MRKVLGTVAIAAMLTTGGCGIFKGKGGKRTPTVGKRIPILVSENEAEVDKGLADAAVTVPLAVANDAWAQPGGNAAKAMGHLALADVPTRRWTASIDAGSNRQRLGAAPVVAENKLFVVDVDATVHAFDARTGARLWTARVPKDEENKAARFGGGVSYDSGKVFATDGLGEIVALSAADGKEIWRAKPGGPLRGAPTLANGQVYVLSQDNQLYALGDADGKVAWTQSGSLETQGVFGVAAPAASSGTVVAGFSSGELNAYRYENGRTLWQDALVADEHLDLGLQPRRHRRRSSDRGRAGLCGRAGWADGRGGHRHRTAAVGAEPRRHLDAVDRGRMAVRADRRRSGRLPVEGQRQGPLDLAVARLQEREEEVGGDHLVRAGARGQQAVAHQFTGRADVGLSGGRGPGAGGGRGRVVLAAARRRERGAVSARPEGPAQRLALIGDPHRPLVGRSELNPNSRLVETVNAALTGP